MACKARKNKVQYVIPTKELTSESVTWNEATKTLTVNAPPPVLDESIVEVQSDPDMCEIRTDVGWARFRSRSGKALEHAIRKELRPSVLQAGRHELLMIEARRKACEALETWFKTFLQTDTVAEGVNVVVTCKE